MKKVNITISLGMEVPDTWNLIEHADGIMVLDMGNGKFLDMTYTPLTTDETVEGATWTDNYEDDFVNTVFEMVTEGHTKMELVKV